MIEYCEAVDGKKEEEPRPKKEYKDVPEPTDFRPLGYEW